MNSKIRHIKSENIDKMKWDTLVKSSPNSLIFNFSWYLDKMCNWDAIIYGDYEGAMPLPYKKVYGLKKIYQPSFVQKCNWFGVKASKGLEKIVFSIVKTNYQTIHFNTDFKLSNHSLTRINLILNLTEYSIVKSAYSKSLKRNLKRSSDLLDINDILDPKVTIELYRQAHGKNNPQLQNLQYSRIYQLVKYSPAHFKCVNVTLNGDTVASILLACHNNRMHYILGAPNDLGRKHNALSVAINHAIESNCGGQQIFDFEGSVIPSVKEYYQRFGSITEVFSENIFFPFYLKPLRWAHKMLFKS